MKTLHYEFGKRWSSFIKDPFELIIDEVDILETGQHKDLLLSTKKRLNLDSSDEIIDLIQKYSNISDEQLQDYKELGKQVRENYFEPVTKEGVQEFMKFSN